MGSVIQQYTDDAAETIETGMRKIGRDTVAMLQTTSPKRTGQYAKSWKAKIEKADGSVSLTVRQTGRNASLTHLLEHGHKLHHAKGRMARAFPHIEPAEEWATKEAEALIKRAVGNS